MTTKKRAKQAIEHVVKQKQADRVDIQKASRLWKEGELTAGQIGAYFNVSKGTIIGVAARNRDLFPAKSVTKETLGQWRKGLDIEEAKALWAAGVRTPDMARKLGVSKVSIKTLVETDRVSFPRRTRGGNHAECIAAPKLIALKARADIQRYTDRLFSAPVNDYDRSRMPEAKPLVDLDRGECKWPIGESPFMFCAAEADGNYCSHHYYRSIPKAA